MIEGELCVELDRVFYQFGRVACVYRWIKVISWRLLIPMEVMGGEVHGGARWHQEQRL